MGTVKITIPLNPITKKNSQQIFINQRTRKPFITTSAAYKQYERDASIFIPFDLSINQPVNIKCLFYMQTKRKVDLTNLLEAIDDILVKCGTLEDDNSEIIKAHDGSRVYYDKENPRTEIEITTFEG
jgi:Holliday junction resolvase RusA-like endonuclease